MCKTLSSPAESRPDERLPDQAYKMQPPRPDTEEYAHQYWKRADELFYRTVGYAEDAFKTSKIINLIVVAFGIAFSVYAIANSILRSLDIFSAAFGTLGVASFIATFFLTPQRKIQRIVGDLTQIQIVYKTYWSQVETILDWVRKNQGKISIDDLGKAINQLDDITKRSIEQIESYIGKD